MSHIIVKLVTSNYRSYIIYCRHVTWRKHHAENGLGKRKGVENRLLDEVKNEMTTMMDKLIMGNNRREWRRMCWGAAKCLTLLGAVGGTRRQHWQGTCIHGSKPHKLNNLIPKFELNDHGRNWKRNCNWTERNWICLQGNYPFWKICLWDQAI